MPDLEKTGIYKTHRIMFAFVNPITKEIQDIVVVGKGD